MRKWLLALLIFLVLVAVGTWGFVRLVGSKQGDPLKVWLGLQLQTVANWYLNPRLSFDFLDYQYPRTIVLHNMKLSSSDPQNGNASVDVLSADKITLQLAEIPQVGNPLLIENIVLDRPSFRALADAPGSGRLIGLSNLVKGKTEHPAKPQPAGTQLTDVFQIRHMEINDGLIIYDPRLPDTPAMEMDHINSKLNIERTGDGWYKLSAEMGRKPVFGLNISGEMNLDTLATREINLSMVASLNEEGNKSLPPRVQAIISKYEVTGTLLGSITGTLPIRDFRQGNLNAIVRLTDGHLAIGEYDIPVKSLTIPLTVRDRKATLSEDSPLELLALDGKLNLHGEVELDDPMKTNATMTIDYMRAEKLLRKTPQGDEPPPFAGRILSMIKLYDAPLVQVMAALKLQPGDRPPALPDQWGWGKIRMDHAELAKVPALSDVINWVAEKFNVQLFDKKNYKPQDTADVEFELTGKYAKFRKFVIAKKYMGINGIGQVGLDKTIEMRLEVGPPEGQGGLLSGLFGAPLAAITGNIMGTYTVGGSLEYPQVYSDRFGKKPGTAVFTTQPVEQVDKSLKDKPFPTEDKKNSSNDFNSQFENTGGRRDFPLKSTRDLGGTGGFPSMDR